MYLYIIIAPKALLRVLIKYKFKCDRDKGVEYIALV